MYVPATKFLFAIIFLLYNEVNGYVITTGSLPLTANIGTPSKNSQRKSCAAVLNKHSLFTVFQSRFYPIQNVNRDQQESITNAKKSLTAEFKKTIKSPFTIIKWDRIGSLATSLMNALDVIDDAASAVKEVYTNTMDLLCLKIHTWLNEQDSNIIAKYLEFDQDTLDIINRAMTELSFHQRKKTIKIDNLLQLFYYTCDLENMLKNEGNKMLSAKQNFAHFLTKFPWYNKAKHVSEFKEDDLIQKIKINLNVIFRKVDDSFAITVPAMKMRILAINSESDVINAIQNRKAIASSQKTIKDFVESYGIEKDGEKIKEYHLSILGILTTHVFSYAVNHFEILSRLRTFEIEKDDENVINEFSAFMDGYLSIFMDRFFELKGEMSQEIVDAMLDIKYFLKPKSRYYQMFNLSEHETTVLNSRPTLDLSQDLSILNYYNKSERNENLDKHMTNLMNKAVNTLFETFIENPTKNRYFEFKNWPKIDYGKKVHNKESLLALMKANTVSAYEILSIFSCEFTLGTELYDTYLLNDESTLLLNSELLLSVNHLK